MKLIPKFLQLPSADKRLLLSATMVLVVIRIGLSLFSFQTVECVLRQTLRRYSARAPRLHRPPVHRIVWGIEVASEHIPGTQTCLVKGLTAQGLFSWYGYSTDLRIGVTRHEDERIEAHLWVERNGTVVIGDIENLSEYTPLPGFEGNRL